MNALSNFPSKKVEQPDRQFSDHERKKLLSMDDMLMPRLVQSGKSLSFSFARKKKSTDVGILKSMETFLPAKDLNDLKILEEIDISHASCNTKSTFNEYICGYLDILEKISEKQNIDSDVKNIVKIATILQQNLDAEIEILEKKKKKRLSL